MVSIILPVYNGEAFLKETIESILIQTIGSFELIIVNDGSTDDTEKIIKSFHDHRIQYYKQENKGVAAAKNEGLRHCNGDFITFHDADDLSLPNRFERLLECFHGDIGFVHSDMLLINELNQPIGYWQSSNIHQDDVFSFLINVGTPFNNGTIIFRSEVLTGLQFKPYKIGEDTEFIMQIATKYASYHIQEPLYLYRRHTSNLTKEISYDQLAEHIQEILGNVTFQEVLNEINWENDSKEKSQLKAQLIIGEALSKRGMILEGINLFEAAIPFIKDEWDRAFFEGMKGLFENRFEDAKQIFLSFTNKDHTIENYLGEAYLSLQNYTKAYEHFMKALKKNPDYRTPIKNLKALGQLNSHHLICQYKGKFVK
ncbi:glycosyltransferase [Anaerobacillus sp. CMMVII]|uniref:glycosyltransferase n=1 Tax=Anaerobacillus sp. CMMVII TaxID=2755588 RepID=UPI0021B7E0AC|nr:glycosyltransferase [Anaerobacillus sp. CMMVII]MCT8140002.1 glycosyltransferase [Anaerobacillus sp. CMMVII]